MAPALSYGLLSSKRQTFTFIHVLMLFDKFAYSLIECSFYLFLVLELLSSSFASVACCNHTLPLPSLVFLSSQTTCCDAQQHAAIHAVGLAMMLLAHTIAIQIACIAASPHVI